MIGGASLPNRREDSLLTRDQLDSMRQILTFGREVIGLTRTSISTEASIEAVDIDNFLKTKQPSKEGVAANYRSQRPRNEFQKRVLSYIFTKRKEFESVSDAKSFKIIDHFNILEGSYNTLMFPSVFDHLYEYFKEVGIVNIGNDQSIGETLCGSYYGYRMSSAKNEVLKSFIRIYDYNIYNKIARFENKLKEENGDIRYSRGNVVHIKNSYVFIGFIEGVGPAIVGLKLVILNHNEYQKQDTLNGIFLSMDNDGSYDFGKTRIVRTDDKYSENNIGYIDFKDLGFDKDQLAIDLSRIQSGKFSESIINMLLMSSINVLLKP